MPRPSTTFHIRMPRDLKDQAQFIVEKNGIDLSGVVRLFFTHIVAKGTVPLPWLTVNGFTLDAEKKLLQQADSPKLGTRMKKAADVRRYIHGL